MASVTLRGLTKTFDGGASLALQELSLEVRDGEFLVLLGPSGCGKTTALRCIAGLEEPTVGEVLIGEREVTHLPPADRDVAMVFQNYALYPHLTARGNIAFGLEVRGVAEPEIARRVQEVAQRLGLTELLDRRPGMTVVAGRGTGRREGGGVVDCGSLSVPVGLEHYEGEIHLGVRPEHVSLCGEDQGMGNAEVVVVEPLGAETLVHLAAGGQPLIARLPGLVELRTGDHVGLKLDRRRLHLFDVAGERLA